jgi:hypothetical protein
MLDGADHRNWSRSRAPQPTAAPARVALSLTLTQSPGRIETHVDSRFAAPDERRGAQLFMALYENRLSSNVAAGENARRILHHDYVVRELVGPLDPDASHGFPLESGWKARDLGVAAFLLDPQGGTLQAVARTACPG